jgi:hypothetical protein
MKDDDKPYAVGYKKPPKSGQFKKGVSGNKKGRPKKKKESIIDKSMLEILKKVLHDTIPISDGQGSKTITKGEAMITQLVNKAINGDLQAIKQLQPLIAECNLLLPEPSKTSQVKGLNIIYTYLDKDGNSSPEKPEDITKKTPEDETE